MESIEKIRPKEADLQGLGLSIWREPSAGVVGEVLNDIDSADNLNTYKLFDLWSKAWMCVLSFNLAGQGQKEKVVEK